MYIQNIQLNNMLPSTYYLVNDTTKEFVVVEITVSVVTAIENALKVYKNWSSTDRIRDDYQTSNGINVRDHLVNDLEYRDLDYYVD
jgi:hypothetical protein